MFLKTERATTVSLRNESLALPSSFSFLQLLPRSSHSLAWVSQWSHSKSRQTCEKCCVPEALASRGPPCAPRASSCSPAPHAPAADQDVHVTLEPGATSHQPLLRCCGRECKHCRQSSSPTAIGQSGLLLS